MLVALYALLVALCLATLAIAGDLSLGRNPWDNLIRTVADFARPSFLDVWFGPERLEYRGDDGTVLRIENRREVEASFLAAVARAPWVTFQMHTLVFGLILVGIVGLGPTAGVLAIALHSMGTYGKLFAESIESLDMAAVDAVRATGAGEAQVFFHGVWPSVLPQFVSHHLYVWEFNIRDSTILGLIGAGGLGLLISEAVSLFQWSRLATLLIVVVALVMAVDALSRRIRERLL